MQNAITYVTPAIINESVSPDTVIPDSYIPDEISFIASPSVFELANCIVHAFQDIQALEIEISDLAGTGRLYASDKLDIHEVKYLYQTSGDIGKEDTTTFTPELLLQDTF